MKKHMAAHPEADRYNVTSGWAVCTIYAGWENLTSKPDEVTCKNCLKALKAKSNPPFPGSV